MNPGRMTSTFIISSSFVANEGVRQLIRTALVTAIGSLSADAVIKSLHKHEVRVIGCDIYPKEWVVDAYSVDEFIQVPKGTDKDNYIKSLKWICTQYHVDALVPLTDVEIDTLNHNREWFDEQGVLLCFSPKETIEICRNKYETYRLLKSSLRATPIVEIIETVLGTAFHEWENITYPLICKPVDGRSSQGVRRIFNKQELEGYLGSVDPNHMIVQPMVPGTVITVDVIRDPNGETIVSIPREELLRTSNGAGTTVHVFHDVDLTNACTNVANVLKVVGCVNFEFIRSKNGNYYFLECNPRFSGGVEFSCMAGYDFIWNHLKCFTGHEIDPVCVYQNCCIARKYEEVITEIG